MNNKYLKNLNLRNSSKRIPICFCIDISRSMDQIIEGVEFIKSNGQVVYEDQNRYQYVDCHNDPRIKTKMDKLVEGLNNFYEAIRDDDFAYDSCESAIVTFNNNASVFEDFDSIENKSTPKFPVPKGNTNLSLAIEKSLKLLEERKQMYKTNNISYFQPWLVLFTDGESTDDTTHVKEKLIELQNNHKLIVYVMSLSDDKDLIKSMSGFSINDPVTFDNSKNIGRFFNFIAKSVSATAAGKVPDTLDNFFK